MHTGFSTKTCTMSSAEKVFSASNFFTDEGVKHYPDSCDGSIIEALISYYLKNDDENNHRNEGKTIKINDVAGSDLTSSSASFSFPPSTDGGGLCKVCRVLNIIP